MVDNFEEDPVIDLVFRESVCNNGEDPVFGYTWPGTYEGCDCRTASSVYSTIGLQRGTCSTNQTDAGC